ncbi:MAG TPA: lipid-A-disaccharide synthase [Candidatus Obscuribacter sp.]|nr:lipid-A-disaccharide synthase [Candidatus Obscuribacter sp.]HNG18172.1 lipid-A-disaccharide synthase [Candidatus Obscuribacter sp.]HNG75368.1 lipid-A-disaccharide synthase [Candidatus Obscuribacter sp.]
MAQDADLEREVQVNSNLPHQEQPQTLPKPATPELMVVVGEPSADKHAARVLSRLKELQPDLHIFGAGGTEMEKAGVELLFNCNNFAVLGIFEVIKSLLFFYNMRQTLLKAVSERKPKAVLLVDMGGFNIQFATALRKAHPKLPIYYFISPQVWASRPWRIDVLGKAITKMLTIFPFEEHLYTDKKIPARFVGHPLLQDLPSPEDLPEREEFLSGLGLDPARPVIAVLPGSRKQEIKAHLPVAIKAMQDMLKVRPDMQFIISRSTERVAPLIDAYLEASPIKALMQGEKKNITSVTLSPNYALYKNVDLIWAKSGTVTLEITLYGRPMLIFYRGNFFSYLLVLIFKCVKNVGMPNLLAGKELVPELIQLDCRADQLVKYSLDIFDVPGLKQEIEAELLTLRKELGQGDFVDNCARELLALTESHG